MTDEAKTIKHNFWYVSLLGDYASGMWCPFESKKEAINYVKKEMDCHEITFEGINEYGDYTIKFSGGDFFEFWICQRKDNEIIKEVYIE